MQHDVEPDDPMLDKVWHKGTCSAVISQLRNCTQVCEPMNQTGI